MDKPDCACGDKGNTVTEGAQDRDKGSLLVAARPALEWLMLEKHIIHAKFYAFLSLNKKGG